MTKDQYYEMCEMMGTHPNEDEIPIELEDLPMEVVLAFRIVDFLPQQWDTFNGIALGRRIDTLPAIYDLFNIEDDKQELTKIIFMIDRLERVEINKSKANKK